MVDIIGGFAWTAIGLVVLAFWLFGHPAEPHLARDEGLAILRGQTGVMT